MLKKVIKFWDKNPCNINHSKKKFLSKEYFLEVSKKKFKAEPHIKKFVKIKLKNKKILDIGCGIGTMGHYFCNKGANYYGLDISKKSLDIAKHRFEIFNLEGKFINGNCELLTKYFKKSDKFDLIYSWGVLHHTPNIKKAINQIYKISTKKTIIKIMLYSKNSYKQIMINNNLDQFEKAKGVPIANSFNRYEIKKLFEKFKIIKLEKDHIFPYIIKYYKKNRYIKQKWFRYMPNKIFKSLEKNLGWHTLITLRKKFK